MPVKKAWVKVEAKAEDREKNVLAGRAKVLRRTVFAPSAVLRYLIKGKYLVRVCGARNVAVSWFEKIGLK